MKVRCINIYNSIKRTFEEKSNSITIGKEYVVLQIEGISGKRVCYRLLGDNDKYKRSILHEVSQFEIISTKIPKSWGAAQIRRLVSFGPITWQSLGFWEGIYDTNDPVIEDTYIREVKLMLQEEGMDEDIPRLFSKVN